MSKALVTGATGFVGSWVARTLLEAGHQVRVLHRATSRLDAIADLEVEHVIGDVTDTNVLDQAVQGIDWVFHVAAISAYWRTGKDVIYKVNVDATRELLKASERAGIKRFIFTSSAAAVGYGADGHAVDETHLYNIDPSLSPYAHSKFLAEAEVYQAIERGLDCVIVNPSVIIGPADLNLISGSLILEMAMGRVPFMPMSGGLTLIDVRDVAKSHLRAAEVGRTGERYLLGTVSMSNQALFKLIASVVGVNPPRIPVPAPIILALAYIADVAKLLRVPLPADVEGNQLRLSTRSIYYDCTKSWRELHMPEVDIKQSIADTYEWYEVNGYLNASA
ncbi:MAG: nucleoside-diphosphate sugar epimerase [Phototrophicales bacterium]|nr:MAG: nucleoside-diphosphate sugar epimerase [Phototrophicales bacterium]